MNILNVLLLVLGIITVLIIIVGYKRRALIMEEWRIRQTSKNALKKLETETYRAAYEEALKEELPKAMKEKAVHDIQKKYNKTLSPEQNSNEYISIIDDLNIFNRDRIFRNKK